jgi:RHS repeat-associated protein
MSTETDALGNVTTMGYDAAGELTSMTAPVPATGVAAPVTGYSYDGDGRQVTETDPDGNVTATAYNGDGLVTSVTDADSNTTSYAYDHDGRETSETDANSNTASTTYNANGLVTSQTDKDGRVTDFSYDNDGNLLQEKWMSGGTAIYTANYAYDAAGNLTSASDNNSAYAYTYNADNSVTQIDNSGTPNRPHVVLNIGYDNMQQETSLSATVASTLDFLNNYSYNADSAITQITQQGQTGGNTVAAKLVNFAFDNDGRLTTISRYANLSATQLVATSTYGYDANSDITSLSQAKGGTSLNSSTYSYDHDGRVTGDSTVDGTDSYSYDAASQLTAATHSYETNETYSFDATGNRTNTGYSTGTNNQLSSDGTYNYLYDANGNMTKQTTISTGAYVTYSWDYHNRLTDVESYNSSNVLQSHIQYTYNVLDQLIERQVDPTGGGTYTTTQALVYDNSGNIVLVYNGSGTLTDRILNGPGANNALADENGSGTVSWLLADNEGTIRDVVQYNSGTNTTTIVDHLEYNSFGVITSQSNSAYQPLFAYTGQMWDAIAGLYYYHARWYQAATGRFISQDPTGLGAGDANLYRYVGNSPSNFFDRAGLKKDPVTGLDEATTDDDLDDAKEELDKINTELTEIQKKLAKIRTDSAQILKALLNGGITPAQAVAGFRQLQGELDQIGARQLQLAKDKTFSLNKIWLLELQKRLQDQNQIGDKDKIIGALPPLKGPLGTILQPWVCGYPGGEIGKDGQADPAAVKVGATIIWPWEWVPSWGGPTGMPVSGGIGIGASGSLDATGKAGGTAGGFIELNR